LEHALGFIDDDWLEIPMHNKIRGFEGKFESKIRTTLQMNFRNQPLLLLCLPKEGVLKYALYSRQNGKR